MKNPIFIVGLPRSGSTLWLNVFAENPKLFRMGEMLFLTPWRKDFRYFLRRKVGDLSNKRNIEKMIDMIFSDEKVSGITGAFWFYDIAKVNDPLLKKKLYHRILESDKSMESIFKILIEEITHFSGYSRCCMKFPVYVNFVPELLLWYPECKIVHIIRDPRAMAISRKNDPGGTSIKVKKYANFSFFIKKIMVFFVIFQYIWTSRLHFKYKKFKNYALFRYEDLLADPEKVIRELCKFTEIDFTPEMLMPREGQASSVTGKRQKGFEKKVASHWKSVISPLEKIIITSFTKASMRRFEYDPKNHPVYFND